MGRWKVAVLIFGLLFFIGSAAVCASLFDDVAVIQANWNLSLPKTAHYTQVYKKSSTPSFHGDGIRYHIFLCENGETMEQAFAWESLQSPTMFQSEDSPSVEKWLDDINVPQDQRPIYNQCVYLYQTKEDGSEIVLLWSKENGYLYVVESFL